MDREIMITRLIVSEVFRYDILNYAFMTDEELKGNYCMMLDVLEADGRAIPHDWEVDF